MSIFYMSFRDYMNIFGEGMNMILVLVIYLKVELLGHGVYI